MATMPKCSGPTLWTRGTSWPLGLSKTKVLRALACLGFRDRDMGNSFRVRGTIILNPKGRKGKKESFFLRLPPYHGWNGTATARLSLEARPYQGAKRLPRNSGN